MSLTLPHQVLQATASGWLLPSRERSALDIKRGRDDVEIAVDAYAMPIEALQDIARAAQEVGDKKTARAVAAILIARDGRFDQPLPSFKAFMPTLRLFLEKGCLDGWIYVRKDDGLLYPELVTGIFYDDGQSYRGKGSPSVSIQTTYYGWGRANNGADVAVHTKSYSFSPQDVTNRRIAAILEAKGLFKETAELRQAHDASMAHFRAVVESGFAKQFRVNGKAYCFEEGDWDRRGEVLTGRRVIHDLPQEDCAPMTAQVESSIASERPGIPEGVGAVPAHPVVKVFDLKSHEYYWVHGDAMVLYEYDLSLRDKLVLPASHRDLLDVLTTDLDAFVGDIIEGKSAGNVILCKGVPGVGKTLTAEVYAELIGKPLYAVHSGNLGTTSAQIHEGLERIFHLSRRWGCVLLLDEADVFVSRRGQDLEHNAIVAEFLRVLEYFEGLLFMTTNRVDDIDEAIVPRCIAIIQIDLPERESAAAIWRVMARHFEAELSPRLLEGLLDLFPRIAPRDIKMLFRLSLRVAKAKNKPLSLEVFRQCAMFRAIQINSAARSDLK